jgi:hypothetical protein
MVQTLRVNVIPGGLACFVKLNHALQILVKMGIHASILEILDQNVSVRVTLLETIVKLSFNK